MSFYDAIRVGASGAGDFEVERSLRFNDGDSTHLSRTPSSAGNRRTFTWSAWIKRGELGATQGRCFGGGVSGSDYFEIYFPSDDGLRVIWYQGGQTLTTTTANFRDPSAWYHFVVAVDTTQSTAGDRIKMYRNNVLLERIQSNPSQNLDTSVNNTVEHNIGKYLTGNASYFDGYMAEVNFIDGLQLTPSSFAETNSDTGQWVPKDTSALTFGTNGFRLNFSDNSGTTATTLGKDSSGNGNNFTPNNFGTGDAVKDTPTNNFCTLSSINDSKAGTISEGNLRYTGGSGNGTIASTFGINPSDTKGYYFEGRIISGNESNRLFFGIGLASTNWIDVDARGAGNGDSWVLRNGDGAFLNNQSHANDNGATSVGQILQIAVKGSKIWVGTNNTWHASGDPAAGSNEKFSNITDTWTPVLDLMTSNVFQFNFGQDSSFSNTVTAQGNTDASGHGDFYYAPPTGFFAMCSANLPTPTILLPENHYNTLVITGNQSTNAVTGLDFQPDWVVYKALNPETGHGETWFHDAIKGPTVRQGIRPYNTTTPPAEVTNASYLVSFDSNGLTVGSDGVYNNYHQYNQTGRLYQALCWDAGETDGATYTVKVVSDSGNKYRFNDFGTSAVTLDLAEGGTYTFDGSDSSMSGHPFVIGTAANGSVYSTGVTYQLDGASVSYSTYTSGYSSATTRKLIITVPASAPVLYYWCSIHSGMGGQINTNSTLGSSNFAGSTQSRVKVNATAGFSLVSYTGTGSLATVGHGLGVKPDVMIIKNRNSEGHGFLVYHTKIGATKNLQLNTNSPEATASNKFNDTEPTSTVFTVNTSADGNQSSQNFISYIFSEVSGYSKFGSYVGNANTDGTYVFCGFEPAFLLIKRSSSGDNNPWIGYNNKRNPFNQVNNQMVWNTTEWENIDANNANLDFVSNGFKLRNSSGGFNGNGGTYIFLAFAHAPFKNGRAR